MILRKRNVLDEMHEIKIKDSVSDIMKAQCFLVFFFQKVRRDLAFFSKTPPKLHLF